MIGRSAMIAKVRDRLRRLFAPAPPAAEPRPAGTPILVYTPGKVGTNALRQGLRVAGFTVYKAHSLNATALRARMEQDRARGRVLHTDRATLKFIENVLPDCTDMKTVTLVREVIGRNMSGFFQTLWRHDIKPPYEGVDVDRLIELFFTRFRHDRADAWFGREFVASTGVRPLGAAFDGDAGFGRYRAGRFDVLLLQMELGNEAMARVLSGFVGTPVQIGAANAGHEKPYGRLYEAFKQRIVFPAEYLQRMLASRVMQTFYTETQRGHIGRFYRREIPALYPLPRAGHT